MMRVDGARERATRADAAELQRLIRYVERWRLAHFQRPDGADMTLRAGSRPRRGMQPGNLRSDRRLADADALLHKLRRGLQTAFDAQSNAPAARRQPSPQHGSAAILY